MTILNNPIKLLFILFCFHVSCFAENGNRILSYSTEISVRNEVRVREVSYLIEVQNADADWISDVSIYYDKNEKVEIREAVILDTDGRKLRKLSDKEISTSSDISYGSFYDDGMVKEFSLKWNEYPYRIQYTYRITSEKFLYIAHWSPWLYADVPVVQADLTVNLQADYEVTMDYSDKLTYEKPEKTGTAGTHHWSISDFITEGKEPFSPPLRELLPSVMIYPKFFTYGARGNSESWSTFGKWQEDLNRNLTLLPESEKKVVDELISGVTDIREKISILYNYMQDHTRYIYVGIDVGGMQPYPASYVCENKFGDCKALTIYMKSLLEHAGIESFYSTIYSGSNPVRVKTHLPFQQFNHVILAVPVENDTIWLENTSNYTPANFLGSFTQDRYSLLVNGLDSKLVRTPGLTATDVEVINRYDLTLDKDGSGKVTFRSAIKGDGASDLAAIKQEYKAADQKKAVSRMIRLKNSDIESFDIDIPDRNIPFATLSSSLTISKQIRNLGDLIAISLPPAKSYNLTKPDERKLPVRISVPVNQLDSIEYTLPFITGYTAELPEALNLSNKFGEIAVTFVNVDDKIIMRRHFQLHKGDFPLEDYEEFYDFLTQIKKYHRKTKIILNRKS